MDVSAITIIIPHHNSNSHGQKPTQYRKKGNRKAIECHPENGPIFGNNDNNDIYIVDACNRENSCWIAKSSGLQYECHPRYKSSLFVNTDNCDDTNHFAVLDYEVYSQ